MFAEDSSKYNIVDIDALIVSGVTGTAVLWFVLPARCELVPVLIQLLGACC